MNKKLTKIPQIQIEELNELEGLLWSLLREREEFIGELKDEIARLKGEKGRPKIKPSRLEPPGKSSQEEKENKQETSENQEKQEILRVGLLVSSYINTDDTGARHQGKNSYCTQIGNDWFAWFETTSKKNRINFLKLLRGEKTEYILSSEALNYMKEQKLPKKKWHKLNLSVNRVFKDEEEWERYLKEIEITKSSHVKKATEGALLGTIISYGVSPELGIMSDGAGQFRLLEHGLCWVHAERLINKLIPLTVEQKTAVELVQDQIWEFYQDLKRYKNLTTEEQNQEQARLSIRFDEIFSQSSCFESLDQVLARLKRRKAELLLVLEKPELPLHNNASEQDIREFVKKRKISGSTRSEDGRRCRDTFASLKKTCRKLGVSFWNYLRDRVSSKNQIPQLGQLIEKKVRSQCPLAMANFVSST